MSWHSRPSSHEHPYTRISGGDHPCLIVPHRHCEGVRKKAERRAVSTQGIEVAAEAGLVGQRNPEQRMVSGSVHLQLLALWSQVGSEPVRFAPPGPSTSDSGML